ncbi:MAG: restriction endonuclease subunit S [Lautropia sp.]|nr:restriction endonuclease subunit S [Lautropia sp.]
MNLKESPLGSLLSKVIDYRGKTPKKTNQGIRLITAKIIKNGKIEKNGKQEYIAEGSYEDVMRRGTPQKNDIFITTEAPLGELAIWKSEERIALAQRVILLRPNPYFIDPDFLFHYLKSAQFQSELSSHATGTTVLGIKNPILRSLPIKYPINLNDQKKIGSILSSYDDLITINQRRIALLEDAARRLYREWFVHLRFPGHEAVPVQDGVPQGWTRGFAHDFIFIMSGGTPKTKIDHYWGGGIPFFTPKDATNSFFVRKTEKTLTNEGLQNCNSQLFEEGTIFITARGTVGKINMAQEPMAMNQSCYALKPKINFDNLFLFMSINAAVSHLKQAATGGVFDTIIVDTFKTIPFTLPEPELTFSFGSKAAPIFDQIKNLIVINERLQLARDLLLPRLMSGKLDVSNIPLPEEVLA